MEMVKNLFTPSQLQLLQQGGYDVALGEAYSPIAQYVIHTYGIYLMALTTGKLSPDHPEEKRFVAVVNGEKTPRNDTEEGWLRFVSEHPEFKDD